MEVLAGREPVKHSLDTMRQGVLYLTLPQRVCRSMYYMATSQVTSVMNWEKI